MMLANAEYIKAGLICDLDFFEKILDALDRTDRFAGDVWQGVYEAVDSKLHGSFCLIRGEL